MDDVYEITLLLDFYGQLLTKRQNEILDLHYNNDFSLGEISEHLGITRQGVYDNVKRGKAILMEYEKKLGLVERFANQKNSIQEVLNIIKGIDKSKLDADDRKSLNKAEEKITKIIESI